MIYQDPGTVCRRSGYRAQSRANWRFESFRGRRRLLETLERQEGLAALAFLMRKKRYIASVAPKQIPISRNAMAGVVSLSAS